MQIAETLYITEHRSVRDIANILHVDKSTVLRQLKKHDIPIRKIALDSEIEKALITEYRQGLTMAALSAKYGYSQTHISRILHKNQVTIRSNNTKIIISEQDFIRMYVEECLPVVTIAQRIGCSVGAINHIRRKYNLPARLNMKKQVLITKEDLVQLYEIEIQSADQISKLYNCSKSTILNRIQDFNIVPRQHDVIIDKTVLEAAYDDVQTIKSTSKKLKVSESAVTKNLKRYNITLHSNSIGFDKDTLYNLYIIKNMSQKEIARQYHCSQSCVNVNLMRYGISKKPARRNDILIEDVLRLRSQGMTLQEIADQYHTSTSVISSRIKKGK